MKGTSLSHSTLDPEHASMLGNDRFAQGQTQAQTIDLSRETGIDSIKVLKNPRHMFWRNAWAVIPYLDLQQRCVLFKRARQKGAYSLFSAAAPIDQALSGFAVNTAAAILPRSLLLGTMRASRRNKQYSLQSKGRVIVRLPASWG